MASTILNDLGNADERGDSPRPPHRARPTNERLFELDRLMKLNKLTGQAALEAEALLAQYPAEDCE
jgi:hypothetical protein